MKVSLACCGLMAGLTLLVHLRTLAGWDLRAMEAVAASRPAALTEPMNWLFRLGFAQLDLVVALAWAGWLLWRPRRGDACVALAPLLLFAAVAIQGGLRLAVQQPAPTASFELQRPFAEQPVSAALDRTDAAARGAFVAVTGPVAPATAERERGSYPSGHTARILFLALAAWSLRPRGWGKRGCTAWVALLGILVGGVSYSALFFGYHWPSDLIGGYLIAAGLWAPLRWLSGP